MKKTSSMPVLQNTHTSQFLATEVMEEEEKLE